MGEEEKPPCNNITTLHTYTTEYNADSVEWCPHEPHQNVFVCATYHLKDSENEKRDRVGCIYLFSVTTEELKLQQTLYTPGILDQKWCHNKLDDRSVLAVANAHKTLEIYSLNSELVQLELITSYKVEDDEKDTLLLSLDWATGKFASNEPEIVCSDSRGNIHRFRFTHNELIKEATYDKVHQFSAWITAFNYWDPNVFFSGADDNLFLKFDKRVGLQPVAKNKSHEAGVTSMHSNVGKEYLLATGSYDSHVRLWDTRSMKDCTSSVKIPGNLWRLKWDPFSHKYLLAASMLGGVHIIDPDQDEKIVDSYYEHKTLSYGSDWSFLPKDSSGRNLIGSCSFYDNLLCVTHVKLDE